MKIYVGNLSYETTEEDLRAEFGAYGEVSSATIIMDRDTGRSKGFGFVEMDPKSKAIDAIAGLNGKVLKDRTLTVNEARPRGEGGGSGGRGNYGGGRGGGGGGGGRYRR
ncbi:MAG: RNA-binding protein [Chloroflexi bacterium]|nr:RNA-binding protein [Chloroflexota bacterium]